MDAVTVPVNERMDEKRPTWLTDRAAAAIGRLLATPSRQLGPAGRLVREVLEMEAMAAALAAEAATPLRSIEGNPKRPARPIQSPLMFPVPGGASESEEPDHTAHRKRP